VPLQFARQEFCTLHCRNLHCKSYLPCHLSSIRMRKEEEKSQKKKGGGGGGENKGKGKGKKNVKKEYNLPVGGLEVVGRSTLRMNLKVGSTTCAAANISVREGKKKRKRKNSVSSYHLLPFLALILPPPYTSPNSSSLYTW
jgi:hypothetical protein